MLIYMIWANQTLLVIKILLFVLVEFFFRPKVLRNYSFQQKIRMSIDPFESGRKAIRAEDWEVLRWYRFSWLTIFGLLLVRLIISLSIYSIGTFHPELL